MTTEAERIAREIVDKAHAEIMQARGDWRDGPGSFTFDDEKAAWRRAIATALASRQKWRPISEAPHNGPLILKCDETIPDRFDIRSAEYIDGASAEELGYSEYAKHGGWLIWNTAGDFYIIDLDEPTGWMPEPPLPSPPKESGG